jgi:MerR family transcriptional regulator, light-induced transcriptional regulator
VSARPSDPAGDDATLGIGELARLTGLTPQLIRAWETRFGFPQPVRTATGRRRYDVRDVDRIARVLSLKDSGSRLAQAVARVQEEPDDARSLSVYGELRRAVPHLGSRVMRRDVLLAVSRAIEDEALARAVRPVVFGAFQREESYLRSSGRWEELARTAEQCLVFADFPSSDSHSEPVRVALDPASPLLREWAVVVSSADFSVVLTAWEIPGDREGRFEVIFTLEPAAVRVAVDVCTAAARAAGVDAPSMVPVGGSTRASGQAADALVLRAFDYLQDVAAGGR